MTVTDRLEDKFLDVREHHAHNDADLDRGSEMFCELLLHTFINTSSEPSPVHVIHHPFDLKMSLDTTCDTLQLNILRLFCRTCQPLRIHNLTAQRLNCRHRICPLPSELTPAFDASVAGVGIQGCNDVVVVAEPDVDKSVCVCFPKRVKTARSCDRRDEFRKAT